MKHHAAAILNAGYTSDVIEYKNITGPTYPYHAALSVHIKRNDGEPLYLPKNQFIEVAPKINGKSYLAGISLNKKNGSAFTVKCVFGGEVPRTLYHDIKKFNNLDLRKIDIEDVESLQDRIFDHLKNILAKELNIPKNKLDISFPRKKSIDNSEEIMERKQAHWLSKNKLSMQAFEIKQLLQANKAYVEDNNNLFGVAGDAFRQPNYQYGHGLNDGLKHAKFLGAVFSRKKTGEEYNDYCNGLSLTVRSMNKAFNYLKLFGRWLLQKLGNERTNQIQGQFSDTISLLGIVIENEMTMLSSPSKKAAQVLLKKIQSCRSLRKEQPLKALSIFIEAEFENPRAKNDKDYYNLIGEIKKIVIMAQRRVKEDYRRTLHPSSLFNELRREKIYNSQNVKQQLRAIKSEEDKGISQAQHHISVH